MKRANRHNWSNHLNYFTTPIEIALTLFPLSQRLKEQSVSWRKSQIFSGLQIGCTSKAGLGIVRHIQRPEIGAASQANQHRISF